MAIPLLRNRCEGMYVCLVVRVSGRFKNYIAPHKGTNQWVRNKEKEKELFLFFTSSEMKGEWLRYAEIIISV